MLPTSGELRFWETGISKLAKKRPLPIRRAIQIVFQNPDTSLNPAHTVAYAIGRPLQQYGMVDRRDVYGRVVELLESVKLDASYAQRRPRELSGGEKQRVAIARAFAVNPSLVVCDEVLSALDVSVQASIINLLGDLQQREGSSYLFITHDLGVVRYISDRIIVMYIGHPMELGTADQVFAPPYHPYTEALLSALPIPDPRAQQRRVRLVGPVPSPIDPPKGCVFHSRCPRKLGEIYEVVPPPRLEARDGHTIYCHIPLEELEEIEGIF